MDDCNTSMPHNTRFFHAHGIGDVSASIMQSPTLRQSIMVCSSPQSTFKALMNTCLELMIVFVINNFTYPYFDVIHFENKFLSYYKSCVHQYSHIGRSPNHHSTSLIIMCNWGVKDAQGNLLMQNQSYVCPLMYTSMSSTLANLPIPLYGC